ncbi:MAG: peptidylprolyl isomerase [candidate division Zixibacteria bacterium]
MAAVKDGDAVKVHYTGKFEDGTVFDSSKEGEPLNVTIGSGNVIPGFEKGIIGMENGATKTITLPPEEAYGPVRDDLVIDVKKSEIPENIKPEVGLNLQMKQANGNIVQLVVSNMTDEIVTLDANHPLAGKTLVFEIKLVEVG